MKHLFCTLAFMLAWSLMTAQQCDTIPVSEDGIATIDDSAMEAPVTSDALAADVAVEASIPLTLNMPLSLDASASSGNGYMDRLSPKYGYYTPAREFSFALVPLVLVGIAARADKANSRQATVEHDYSSHNIIDNYFQYTPLAAVWDSAGAVR